MSLIDIARPVAASASSPMELAELGPSLADTASRLHQTALQAFRLGNRGRFKLAQCLRALKESRQYLELGAPSIEAYAQTHFRMKRSATYEAIRVAKALDELSAIRDAFLSGGLDWSSVRELTRIAAPDTDAEWSEFARVHTTAEVAAEVRDAEANQRRRPRDRDGGLPNLDRNLVVRLRASEHERVMRGLDRLAPQVAERLGGAPVDTKQVLLFLAEWLLETEPAELLTQRRPRVDPSAAVIYRRCTSCREGEISTEDGWIRVESEELDRVESSAWAESLEGGSESNRGTGEASVRPNAKNAKNAKTNTEAIAETYAEANAKTNSRTSTKPNPKPNLELCVEHPIGTGADAAMSRSTEPTIDAPTTEAPTIDAPTTPVLRRKVLLRDGGRCANPRCSHRADHAHHIVFRMHGGKTTLENEVAVCSTCHALIHAGLLRVRGRGGAQLNWERTSSAIPALGCAEETQQLAQLPEIRVILDRSSAQHATGTPAESTARRSPKRTVQRSTESTRVDWLRRHGPGLEHGLGRLGLSKKEARDRVRDAVASMTSGWTEAEVLRRALAGR